MKKFVLIGFVGAVMFGLTGCTYTNVYAPTEVVRVIPRPQPIPIMFRHEGYPETYHLPSPPPPRHRRPIDRSTSPRNLCPECRYKLSHPKCSLCGR